LLFINVFPSRRFSLLQASLVSDRRYATLPLFVFWLVLPVRAAPQDSPKAIVDEVWQLVNHEVLMAYLKSTGKQPDRL